MSPRERIRELIAQTRLWLMVGIGIKRWLVLVALATLILGVGALSLAIEMVVRGILPRDIYNALTLQFLSESARITVFLIGGVGLLLFSLAGLSSTLISPFRRPGEKIPETLLRYRRRNRGPRIVAIGGGTGMPGLLRGLKVHTSNITAIVTVADDGGSSGRLRREFGLLPPGDFRNNISALARDEGLITQLMQYRFGKSVSAESESQLSGHAFGNLLIAALVGITGSFDEALLNIDRVLAMRGKVMPSTLDEVRLDADVEIDGRPIRVEGESAIPKSGGRIQRVMLEPAKVRAYPPAIRAILRADLVVMGPGSLYTSVLPNLIVPGISSALSASRAKKVYICNVAEQPGETDGFAVSDHVEAIVAHTEAACVDYVVANNNQLAPDDERVGVTTFVPVDGGGSAEMIAVDLINEERPWRHDSEKVAEVVMQLLTGRS